VTAKGKKKEPATPETERRSQRAIAICLVGTALLLAADLGSKAWAMDTLSTERTTEPPPVCQPDDSGYMRPQRLNVREPYVLVEDHVELRYAENCGAAFGLLRNAPGYARHAVFGTAALAATIALLWMFVMGRGGRAFAWSVPFIVSGALGNLADRLRLGYVVDFIRVYWETELPWVGTQWPTFNIADVTITIGIVLLLIDGQRQSRAEKAAAKDEEAGADEEAAESGAKAGA
jgi:signal peptidase II